MTIEEEDAHLDELTLHLTWPLQSIVTTINSSKNVKYINNYCHQLSVFSAFYIEDFKQ